MQFLAQNGCEEEERMNDKFLERITNEGDFGEGFSDG